ncbi:MAG: substrate-binding domain-containing protein [Streptosporangiales bacterium]|nr:substrate-binding domain-containing protein [Streptosporangiales bacterium]
MAVNRRGLMRAAGAALAATVLLTGVACGSSGGGEASGGSEGGANTPGAPSIGVAEINLSLPFFVEMRDASDKIAADYGVNVTWQSADGSLEKEISIVEDFIAQDKDVIMIDPLNAKALAPVVNKARKAGIEVITMGNKVEGEGNHNTLYPDHDNWVLNARILGTTLGGKGKVLLLIGSVGNYVSDTRQKAFEQTMKEEFPNIQVITQPTNFDSSTAANVTQTVLTNHPDLAGIASISDGLTLPALKVLQARDKLGMPFVTNDGDPKVYPYLEKGQVLNDVLTGSHRVGAWNTAVGARLAKGSDFPTDLFMPTYVVASEQVSKRLSDAGLDVETVTPDRARQLAQSYPSEFAPSKPDKAMSVE